MLQKVTMFAAAGKFWKKFMVICPKFCSFLALNSAYKVGFPPLFLKIFPLPFFPHPKIFLWFPSFLKNSKIGFPPFKKGGDPTVITVLNIVKYLTPILSYIP